MLQCDHWLKVTEQYFAVVLFIMFYRVVLTFGTVDEILPKFDRFYWTVLSRGNDYSAVQGQVIYLFSLWMKSLSVTIEMKAT